MVLFFVYTHDGVFEGVKMETSLLGERRLRKLPTGEEVEMLDELVLDEEYMPMFRRLFLQSRADLMGSLPPEMVSETPTDMRPVFREFPDFSIDRDFPLWLRVGDGFPVQYRKSIDVKIEEFLIDRICGQWLAGKSPDDAEGYLLKAGEALEQVKGLLRRRTAAVRRLPGY